MLSEVLPALARFGVDWKVLIIMGHIDHLSYGLYTPAVGFVVMAMAAAVGLRCTVRALDSSGSAKRGWLFLGASAIGAGIWTLHFIAMMGFGVGGTEVRYDVRLTLLSLVLAIGIVSAGVFTVGYFRDSLPALLIGGLGTGLGVATMHYSGMAAVNISGVINYNMVRVVISVAIAVTAATVALWIVLNIKGLSGTFSSAVIMGVAVTSMHYTAMSAVSVELDAQANAPSGATALEFLLPLSIAIGSVLFIACTVVAVSPIEDDREDAEIADRVQALNARREHFGQDLGVPDLAQQRRHRHSMGLRGEQSTAAELASRASTQDAARPSSREDHLSSTLE